jgi:hypothetical protein
MAVSATTLYWKLEDMPVSDGEAPHPEDIGPGCGAFSKHSPGLRSLLDDDLRAKVLCDA